MSTSHSIHLIVGVEIGFILCFIVPLCMGYQNARQSEYFRNLPGVNRENDRAGRNWALIER